MDIADKPQNLTNMTAVSQYIKISMSHNEY